MKLFPHQIEGVRFLAQRRRAYLADDMGLGKSAQALCAAERVGARSILVIAPASLLPNWRHEFDLWGPRFCRDINIISYTNQRMLETAGQFRWDVVILDEAHYCKNPNAKRTRAALAIAAKAKYAWLLSGTPMPNHPGELYAPMAALWPEVCANLELETYDAWVQHFCRYRMVQFGRGRPQRKIYGHKNLDDLKPYMPALLLRRRLADIALELPPLRIHLSRLKADAGLDRALAATGANVTMLRQAIEHAEQDDTTSKLRRLLGEYKAPRIAEQISCELTDHAYRKIVVLAYHHSVLDTLKEGLKGHGVVGFRGGDSGDYRQDQVDRFNTDPTKRVFLAQQTAAGVGLNLQAASEIVLVEPAWSPDDNAQAIKRIHRIGQDAPCRARIFTVAGSMDEAVMKTLQRKLQTQRSLGLK